jgi:membrane associated rhomboid family serine protease
MWKRQVTRVRTYTYGPKFTAVGISGFYDSIGSRISHLLQVRPSGTMLKLNQRVQNKLCPAFNQVNKMNKLAPNISSTEWGRAFSGFRYKGVAGLILLNIGTFMTLNSRYMKSRSHVDGLQRSDRHFIASRYNIERGRVWCVPLSIFNHGDSLMHLIVNCFAFSLVGPAVEMAFGTSVLVSGFIFTGMFGALAEVVMGNHWCRGSSAGTSGIFGLSALAAPQQMVSIWGLMDVRTISLAITIFGVESLIGLFGSNESGLAHMAHAGGLLAAIPFMYYLKWFRL